jgi:hypothetical protein
MNQLTVSYALLVLMALVFAAVLAVEAARLSRPVPSPLPVAPEVRA